MNTSLDKIKNIINNLPEKPGIYQYFNSDNKIIYIGKAKKLKRRVSSYFNRDLSDSPKTRVLVSQIRDIKYIVVDSEQDALLLENNLIKKYTPKYNILLKDDKTYSSICIKRENFPRIYKTRNIIKDGSEYYGPYSSVKVVDIFLNYIRKIYPIRRCNLYLSREKIKNKKYKACLQYHIKNCEAPCMGYQSEEEYNLMIKEARELIKGNIQELSDKLYKRMKLYSSNYEFEKAEKIKEKYLLIENYKAKSIIVSQTLSNIDVCSYEEENNTAYINMLRVVKGSIIQGLTIEIKKRLEESKEELLGIGIIELRQRFDSKSHEIIVPFLPDIEIKNAYYTIPQRGDKKKLLELSVQNTRQYKLDRIKQREKLNPEQKMVKILSPLKEKLRLKELPTIIECFDNSNIQGTNAVAACVVYKNGKPSKRDYRKYNIKTVEGPDDYASMKEVVYRRYKRIINEKKELPKLIITDGGKGQMEVVREIVEDELKLNIPIAGLAKNEHHRTKELLFGFPPKVIGMKPNDEIFRFLTNIQDEVHRFAITFHKQKRSKEQTKSELDNIKGIGEKSKSEILKAFKSVKRLRLSKFEDIEKIIGNHRATIIYNHFNGNSSC